LRALSPQTGFGGMLDDDDVNVLRLREPSTGDGLRRPVIVIHHRKRWNLAPENSGLFVSGTFTFTFTSTFTWRDSRFCLASQESLGGILDDDDADVVRIRAPSTDSGLRSDGMWHNQYED
jgi:hypothetical protein